MMVVQPPAGRLAHPIRLVFDKLPQNFNGDPFRPWSVQAKIQDQFGLGLLHGIDVLHFGVPVVILSGVHIGGRAWASRTARYCSILSQGWRKVTTDFLTIKTPACVKVGRIVRQWHEGLSYFRTGYRVAVQLLDVFQLQRRRAFRR